MKKIIAAFMVFVLMITAAACKKEDDLSSAADIASAIGEALGSLESTQESAAESGADLQPAAPKNKPSEAGESSVSEKPPESSAAASQEDELNSALLLIPGGERLLESDDQNLFLLKEYGLEMQWTEADTLEHLEQGTPGDAVGEYDVHFLLIPKYTGTRVEVNRVDYDESKGLYPSDTIYQNANTPDSYGLVLTSSEPEGIPDLSVTVEYGGATYTYVFYYDGRGDRPALLALPEDEDWPSKLDALSS